MRQRLLALSLLLALAPLANAQDAPSAPKPLTAADRHVVITTLSSQLQAHYVFPDVAKALSVSLAAKEASGGYDVAKDTESFAEALSTDLRTLGQDGHFQVAYFNFTPPPAPGTAASAERAKATRLQVASHGFGIDSVRRLPGNVGYLELRSFGPADIVAPAFSAAMTMLSGTDGLILDLRRNGGGEPASVAYLMSHFFAADDERHLNDIYFRDGDTTQQFWTNAAVTTHYTRPVYVLTSARTFSGGEECAYDFQTQKRATVVGEVTGGGANPGDGYVIGGGFAAFIPNGRAINPITKTNWEHTGVKPDIAAPAADAQKVAHAALLRERLKTMEAGEEKSELQDTLKKVEAGEVDAPVYALRR